MIATKRCKVNVLMNKSIKKSKIINIHITTISNVETNKKNMNNKKNQALSIKNTEMVHIHHCLFQFKDHIAKIADAIANARMNNGKIILFGNGGSAADAQHIAAEFVGVGYPAISLTADTSVITALANDFNYVNVFSKQVDAFAMPNDIVIGISTSGKSPNVLRGLFTAFAKKLIVVALVGNNTDDVWSTAHHEIGRAHV
mgnify:CR=1 FL=1